MGIKKKKIHDNPDPLKYSIIHTKEGDVLRRKRSSPNINSSLQEMAEETCSGAAREILQRLKPFTGRMSGRMNVRISGKMRSAKKQTSVYNYSLLNGFELQKYYPMDALYSGQYQVRKDKYAIYIDIPAGKNYMKAHNSLVTHYYFEAVAIFGDAMQPGSLRVEDDKSQLFDFGKANKSTVTFSFVLPQETPYLIWLKVGCREGNEEAKHPMHYGMKVVAVG